LQTLIQSSDAPSEFYGPFSEAVMQVCLTHWDHVDMNREGLRFFVACLHEFQGKEMMDAMVLPLSDQLFSHLFALAELTDEMLAFDNVMSLWWTAFTDQNEWPEVRPLCVSLFRFLAKYKKDVTRKQLLAFLQTPDLTERQQEVGLRLLGELISVSPSDDLVGLVIRLVGEAATDLLVFTGQLVTAQLLQSVKPIGREVFELYKQVLANALESLAVDDQEVLQLRVTLIFRIVSKAATAGYQVPANAVTHLILYTDQCLIGYGLHSP
jgi:hypothetical protein